MAVTRLFAALTLGAALLGSVGPVRAAEEDVFDPDEIVDAARGVFGTATEGLAEVVEKLFADLGRPNAYIAGGEVGGAVGVGLTYGRGTLRFKSGGSREVFWTGPSIGFDLGGDASKVFVLVYDLPHAEALFRRFPGVDGSFYYVGGVGANLQRSEGITLAPIRAGAGLRARASVGYTHYTRKRTWVPF